MKKKIKYGEIPKERKYWLVRAGVEANYSFQFEQNKFIALGWDRFNLKSISQNLDDLKTFVGNLYPEIEKIEKENFKRKISDIATKLYKFYNELKIGDIVITPTNDNHILIGVIVGNIEIISSNLFPIKNDKDKFGDLIGSLNKKKEVKWLRKIDRNKLEPNLKNHVRSYHGISKITIDQVITEINREIFNVYIKEEKAHSIFYIKQKGDIDGYKYAFFIEKMTQLIKIAENQENKKINFSIKTNIQSPGPLELIIPKTITNIIINGMNAIFKKDPEALSNIDDENTKQKIKNLADSNEYEYDDYDFPCSGSY